MSSTTTNPQIAPAAPIIYTESVIDAGTTTGIEVPSANLITPQVSVTSESIPEQANHETVQQEEKQQEARPTPKRNFITKYREYADVVEAPPEAHEAVAMALLAAVLNRNGVLIEHGAVPVSMDFWLILISESGFGRNTLVSLAAPVLKQADLADLVRPTAWGSDVALYQDIAENPHGLFVWPEMSVTLKKLGQPNFGGAKEWMTNCYDEFAVPNGLKYRTTGKGKDTPPIEFSQPPRFNILATSSEDWLLGNLVQEDTTGGFLPRFLLLKLDRKGRIVPIPKRTNPRLRAELVELLKVVKTLKGEVIFSEEVKALYIDWYYKTYHRFMAQENPALAKPFFNRLRSQVVKLAVIHEVAESQSLNVTVESMKKAIETAAKIEETIFTLLPTAMTREGAELLKIEQLIQKAGVEGVKLTTLTRAFQSTPTPERKQRIQTLCDGGAVFRFRRGTTGRAAVIHVYKDYVEEHKTKYPHDVEF